MKIIQVEGKQTGDLVALNLDDHRQSYCSWLTSQLAGSFRKVEALYSKPPWGEVMLSVLEDTLGIHFVHAGRCNSISNRIRFGRGSVPNCQDNLARVLRPYGIEEDAVPDVFNLFMNMSIDAEGTRASKPSPAKKGDYIEFRAEMDCLVALSACPDSFQEVNDHKTKPLLVQIAG